MVITCCVKTGIYRWVHCWVRLVIIGVKKSARTSRVEDALVNEGRVERWTDAFSHQCLMTRVMVIVAWLCLSQLVSLGWVDYTRGLLANFSRTGWVIKRSITFARCRYRWNNNWLIIWTSIVSCVTGIEEVRITMAIATGAIQFITRAVAVATKRLFISARFDFVSYEL